MIMQQSFKDMQEAWSPVLPINFQYVNSEVNPHFANIVSPTEVVVISTFHVELEGGGGDLHVTMPYSMLEPIRELLDAGVQSDRSERDERWTIALREEIKEAKVELSVSLGDMLLTLKEVMELKPGDVIPVQNPEIATACVQDIPVFRGTYGSSRGNVSIKVTESIDAQLHGLRQSVGEKL